MIITLPDIRRKGNRPKEQAPAASCAGAPESTRRVLPHRRSADRHRAARHRPRSIVDADLLTVLEQPAPADLDVAVDVAGHHLTSRVDTDRSLAHNGTYLSSADEGGTYLSSAGEERVHREAWAFSG